MQLEEGLSVCNVLQSIQKFPSVWKVLFQPSQEFQMNSEKFLDEAVVEYITSQVLRDKEITTYKFFSDMVLLLDDGECYGFCVIFFLAALLDRNCLSIILFYGGPQLSHYIFSFNQIKFVHIKLKLLTSN